MNPSFSFTTFTVTVTVISISLILPPLPVDALGSASTLAISYSSGTVCGILASSESQSIECYRRGQTIQIQPNVSFQSLSGGRNFFCGLRSGGFSLLCWDTVFSNASFRAKRIYFSYAVRLTDLTVGESHVCALEADSGWAKCWRGGGSNRSRSTFPSPKGAPKFRTITSGRGFSCGILKSNSRVLCWGNSAVAAQVEDQFGGSTMSSLVAGDTHACGLTTNGVLICKGNNNSGQLDVPYNYPFEISAMALGSNHSCAIRQKNGFTVCWGGGTQKSEFALSNTENVSFESIVSGTNFLCGLTTRNLTLICWGPGWSGSFNSQSLYVPLPMIIPGPCVQSSCSSCGMYLNSNTLCSGSGNICKLCGMELPLALPLPPLSTPSQTEHPFSPPKMAVNKLWLAFAIVGSVGAFAGICTIIYCIWLGVCSLLGKKIYNFMKPTTSSANAGTENNSSSSDEEEKSHSQVPSPEMGGTSSKHADKTQIFSLSGLSAATRGFSPENIIGSGSFGTVYRGKLANGQDVAIKRAERSKKLKEMESAFDSELVLLSNLQHKNLVGLIGFCKEEDERLLVYEYMINGSLHDHLHVKNSRILNSWKIRIRIALDAARGIEYLHNYAVPPIIHRDIKTSNILLDSNFRATVSDFGLSLMGPQSDQEFVSIEAVGTVGYIDPEYYVTNVLTAKSDVYGLGVVLLELLTGKRAVFKNEEEKEGVGPIEVVDYAGPSILTGRLERVLDRRVEPLNMKEAEAVELLANTAMNCVNLEGKQRPSVSDIVANLERALALCEESLVSVSSPTTFTLHSHEISSPYKNS